MRGLFMYCRTGFESECAAEIQERAAEHGVYGYCKAKESTGYVIFVCLLEEADHLAKKVPVDSLVFSRQLVVILDELNNLSLDDRIDPMLQSLQAHQESHPELLGGLWGRLWIETPDTNEGRALSGLCKSIYKPLSIALQEKDWLASETVINRPVLHVIFRSTNSLWLAYSYSYSHYPYENGIARIRAPKFSPSRSGAKLAEALKVMVPTEELDKRLHSGMNAVDLGACPGGWTSVLVQHDCMVTAVDNGAISEELLETGQVTHIQEDGFVYRPQKKNVHWLVCDMVEKPARVSELMAQWFIEGYCQQAVFNLKLPMKRRYLAVQENRAIIEDMLNEAGVRHWKLSMKHLYHDREEVTCFLRHTLKKS